MSLFTPAARPHVAERRALHHLVGAGPSGERATPGEGPTSPVVTTPDPSASWRDLLLVEQAPTRPPARVLVAAPAALEHDLLSVVTPLCGHASRWDGRTPGPAPDLLIGALPWYAENLGDVPDLPGPFTGRSPAVLPLTFGARSVTVGPIAGAGGACARCVVPVVAEAAQRPDTALAPALFAFAAGTAGLFLRALATGDVTACSISLTVDLAAPHIEHRLWSCASTCRKAA